MSYGFCLLVSIGQETGGLNILQALVINVNLDKINVDYDPINYKDGTLNWNLESNN